MMKKKKLLFVNLLFSLLCVFSFISCDFKVDWNGNLTTEIPAYISTPITFYKDSIPSSEAVTKYFIKGKNLTVADFPNHTDSSIQSLKPGYEILGWTIMSPEPGFVYTQRADSTLESLTVPENPVYVYGNWTPCLNTPYKICYWLEDKQNNSPETYNRPIEKRLSGTTDTTVTIDDSTLDSIEGFEYISGSQSLIIDGTGTASIDVYFNRKLVTLSFDGGNGAIAGNNTISGKYGLPVSQADFNAINVTRPGYTFFGWNSVQEETKDSYEDALEKMEPCPETFTIDTTYYPVWGPTTYFVKLYDQYVKPVTGNPSLSLTAVDLNGRYIWAENQDLEIQTPTAPAGSDVEFVGWYKNSSDCSLYALATPAAGQPYIISRSSTSSDIDLYAKWKYKKIYVDPENGNDDNSGMTPATALKTIAEARTYDIETIVLCSPITTVEDIEKISGIDNRSITIERQLSAGNQYTFPFINFSGDMNGATALNNVTFDGGADFEQNNSGTVYFTAENTATLTKQKYFNKGKTSTTALIVNSGYLILGDRVTLKNNQNTTDNGGAIYNTGKLVISAASGADVVIQNNNSAKFGGGIYHRSIQTMTLENVIIKDNSAASSNGTSGQGGGICINSEELTAASTITLNNVTISNNRSISSGGGFAATADKGSNRPYVIMNNVTIENNQIMNKNGNSGTGGGLYSKWSDVTINQSKIKNNYAGDNGGGITSSQGSPLTCDNVLIDGNTANGNGGGLSTTGGSSGTVTLIGGTVISNNNITGAGSKGKGVYMSNSVIVFQDAYVHKDNDIYFTTNNSVFKVNASTPLSATNYSANSGLIAVLTPDLYTEDKKLIDNDNANADFSSLFKVTDSSDGKKWEISQADVTSNGLLHCVSGSGSGTIVTPLERDIIFTVDKQGVPYTLCLKYEGLDIIDETVYVAKLLYMGTETGIELIKSDAATPITDEITIPDDYPSGTYRITIDGTYLGTPFYKYSDITK